MEHQLVPHDEVIHRYSQTPIDDPHVRLALLGVAQKDDPPLASFSVVLLAEAIGDEVFVEDVDPAVGIQFLDSDGVLHGIGATGTATISGSFTVGAHALDHHHFVEFGDLFRLLDNALLQLQLGEHTWIQSMQVLGAPILLGAGGHDSYAVFNFPLLGTPAIPVAA